MGLAASDPCCLILFQVVQLVQASKSDLTQSSHRVSRRLREGALLLLVAIAVYLFISLGTYFPEDPGWSFTGSREQVSNAGGPVGAWFADVLLYLFGYLAFLFPIIVAWSGLLIHKGRNPDSPHHPYLVTLRWLGFLIILTAGCTLFTMHLPTLRLHLPNGSGGILGILIRDTLVDRFSFVGGSLLLLALVLSGVTLFTGISWLKVMDLIGGALLGSLRWLHSFQGRFSEYLKVRVAKKERSRALTLEKQKVEKRKLPKIEPKIKQITFSERVEREKQIPLFESLPDSELPPLALLEPAKKSGKGYSDEALEAISRQVELKLRDFGVEAEVESVHPGPVVTMFELALAAGTKASKITNLAKDLARALSTTSVRVVEVIPGKSVIGLEIPNEHREVVYLSEILNSSIYDNSKSPLTLALGKDITGNPTIADLARMPHALIAGTTGSGKSVAINAMVLSLLYKASPLDVRLIMVDPKMLELSVYEGIPHLLTPVVTDMKEAANALRWCVGEMERRYRLMASLGVRNISGYNKKIVDAEKRGEPILDPLFESNPLIEEEEVPILSRCTSLSSTKAP